MSSDSGDLSGCMRHTLTSSRFRFTVVVNGTRRPDDYITCLLFSAWSSVHTEGRHIYRVEPSDPHASAAQLPA